MSDERDYMHEPSMVEMSKALDDAREKFLEAVMLDTLKAATDKLEAGALLGDGGKAFRDVIVKLGRDKLNTISGKLHELQMDIDKAIQAMREAEGRAQKRFS